MPERACRHCGMKSRRWLEPASRGRWECSNVIGCFNRVYTQRDNGREQIERLLRVGNRMANVCFNLANGRALQPDDRDALIGLYQQWGAVVALGRVKNV